MMSVDLFFCLLIGLTISSLSEGAQKNELSTGASRKFNGDIFGSGQEYCDQDWRLRLKNSN